MPFQFSVCLDNLRIYLTILKVFRFPFQVNNVAVVFASEDDLPASVFMLSLADCLPYYYEWLGRLEQYKKYMNDRENHDLYVNSWC